jgi:hypothetical protein
MRSNLHTPPKVDNACDYSSVANINKCRTVAGGLRQILTVESVEHIPLEI